MTAHADARPGPLRGGTVEIRPDRNWSRLDFAEIWRFRELLYVLVVREVKVRYRQAAIGIAWAIIQPLFAVLIFSVIFGRFAKMPSGGAPYPIFVFAAILPWTYFAEALRRTSTGLVSDSDLIRKIYFPRLIVPLALAVTPLVDFAAGFLVLLAMFAWFHVAPTLAIVTLPLFLLLALGLALAIGLWLGPFCVRYRDVVHAMPFLIQVWMYASPVAYSMSIVPERWRLLYSLNPMVGVVEGFRWALLGMEHPNFKAIGISCALIVVCLALGLVYFRKMERSFADVI